MGRTIFTGYSYNGFKIFSKESFPEFFKSIYNGFFTVLDENKILHFYSRGIAAVLTDISRLDELIPKYGPEFVLEAEVEYSDERGEMEEKILIVDDMLPPVTSEGDNMRWRLKKVFANLLESDNALPIKNFRLRAEWYQFIDENLGTYTIDGVVKPIESQDIAAFVGSEELKKEYQRQVKELGLEGTLFNL
ncbi:MAG: hypothetical protein J7L45_02600 [Candidatus Aenigmarchaeota archaeon]|nr:hypothetical protein [Candidatus Aenigmarchaeota archaeon]